jgi:hypothetical protein
MTNGEQNLDRKRALGEPIIERETKASGKRNLKINPLVTDIFFSNFELIFGGGMDSMTKPTNFEGNNFRAISSHHQRQNSARRLIDSTVLSTTFPTFTKNRNSICIFLYISL